MMEIKIASRTCPDELGRPEPFTIPSRWIRWSPELFPAKTTVFESQRKAETPLSSPESPPALCALMS